MGQNWSAKMKGSITKDYSAYKITTGSDTQNLALVFGEGIEEETTASFQVTWLELAKVQVVKVDSEKEDAKTVPVQCSAFIKIKTVHSLSRRCQRQIRTVRPLWKL